MQTFSADYSRTGPATALIAAIPVLIMTPLIIALAILGPDELGGAGLIIGILIILGGGIFLTIKAYRKYASVPSEVSLGESGIVIKLLRRSFLYGNIQYDKKWENIKNVSSNFDPQNDRKFYQLSFDHPSHT